jgi:apolipoprotein N-acyltransferase
MKLLLLSFLLGLLSACGFEPLRLWPLTILAFAGLLWLLGTAPSLKARSPAAIGSASVSSCLA